MMAGNGTGAMGDHASADGSEVLIRPMRQPDAAAVTELYNHYIANTVVTFEEQPLTVDEMSVRLRRLISLSLPWLVAERAGTVLGYAYAAPWKERSAYRFCVESSVYLAEGRSGRGLGTRLYRALLAELASAGMHAVIAGITLPNPASVALHEKMGFRPAGHFPGVGRKFNRWVDVGYWLLTFPENTGPATP